MKKNVITYSLTFMLMLLVGTLLTQCSDEEYASGASSDQICFGEAQMAEWLSSESDDNKTRGAEVTSFKSTTYTKYLVYAWAKPKDGDYIKYIGGESVKSSSGVISGTNYFWPSSDYAMRFLALAPTTLASSVNFDEKGISMDYTVPDEVTEQNDLLFALTDQPTRGEAVQLQFNHMLTSVQLKLKDDIKKVEGIKSVSLKNVYSSGTMKYTLNGDDSFEWSNLSEKKEFISTYKSGKNLATGDYTFMMLPQDFTADDGNCDAEIVLTLADKTLTYKLSDAGIDWKAGHRVIYTLSYYTDVNVFDVPESIDMSADDTSLKIPVLSRNEETQKVKPNIKNTPLDWEIVGDVPDWLNSNSQIRTEEGKDTLTFTTTAADSYVEGDRWLQEQTPKSGTVDLSDGCKNTANCYIINAAGTYKFPLVYGNAIKNGVDNTEAYQQTGYVNHKGENIISPYIYKNNNCTPGSVELLWQDKEGLITSVGLSDNNKYITFTTANPSKIGQGNAVIAVRDNTKKQNIMWSWHIWVTFYEPGKDPDIDNYWRDKVVRAREPGSRTEYTIMPINLGWCDSSHYFNGRTAVITIRQTTTGEERKVKVIQRPKVVGVYGSQPFYQWCRKDPFMAADVSGGFNYPTEIDDFIKIPDKAAYDISGDSVSFNYAALSGIKNMIMQPDKFNTGSSNSVWWGGDIPWKNSVKTIYDPSPVGYRIVEREALTVISTQNGEASIEKGTINTPFTNAKFNDYSRYPEIEEANGWVFYCYPKVNGVVDPSGGTFFMPISLYRRHGSTYKGHVMYDNKGSNHFYGSGTVWATVWNVEDPGDGFCMGFYGHHVKCMPTDETSQKCYGRAVRCMKE